MFKRIIVSSITFFLSLFLINFIFINDFSYMGVKNQSVEEIIKNDFLWVIIFTFFSHIAIYLFLGFISSIYVYVIFKKIIWLQTNKIINTLAILLFTHLLIFNLQFKRFPQFFDEALQKNDWLKSYFYFISDSISIYFFLIPLIILSLTFIYCLITIIKQKFLVSTVLGLLVSIFFYFSFGSAENNIIDKSKPNIIFIAADSFRKLEADTLNVLSNLNTFGNLYSFNNVKTAIPRTFPSWVSIMTSRYPKDHLVYNMFPKKKFRLLTEENPLGEVLKKQGYETTVSADFAGDIFSRIDFGFENIKTPYFNFETMIKQRILECQVNVMPYLMNNWAIQALPYIKGFAKLPRADIVTDEALDVVYNHQKPFFLTLFYSDAHFPYSAPYPYYPQNSNYRGINKYLKNQTITKDMSSSEDKNQVKGLFKGSLEHINSEINRLVDVLIDKKEIDNTIIVFFSDHGENMFDLGGIIGHGEQLYDETTMTIPLRLFIPKKYQQDSKINTEQLASALDIYPTILDLLNINKPNTAYGNSLLKDSAYAVFAETGLWFVNNNDEFYQKERIMYPDVAELLEIEWSANNEPSLKDDYLPITEKAKHRVIYKGNFKLIYVPTEEKVHWYLYLNNIKVDLKLFQKEFNDLKKEFFNHYQEQFAIEDEYLYLK